MESNVSIADSIASITEKPKLTMALNENASSFIRLVGMPPPDLMDPSHTLGPGLASSNDALLLNSMAFPELVSGENPAAKEVDLIDAGNEDPFTLDTFESLIKAHMEAKKDFILARVLTMEEKEDSKRLFYSYYAAHQINRSLFRTQPDEGLLHRMKAKNPMNNLTIVGDVHYYVIKHADSTCNPFLIKGQETEKLIVESINKSTALVSEELSIQDFLNETTSSLAADNVSIEFEKSSRIQNGSQDKPMAKSPGNESVAPLTFVAKYYATDDDYLMRRYVREYFKVNALNPEDIFLFTLFGASQHTGDSFTSPYVSDPTNPTAIACTLELAVSQYMASQNSAGIPNTSENLNENAESAETPYQEQSPNAFVSMYNGLLNAMQSILSGRPRYSAQSESTVDASEMTVRSRWPFSHSRNSSSGNLSDSTQDEQPTRRIETTRLLTVFLFLTSFTIFVTLYGTNVIDQSFAFLGFILTIVVILFLYFVSERISAQRGRHYPPTIITESV